MGEAISSLIGYLFTGALILWFGYWLWTFTQWGTFYSDAERKRALEKAQREIAEREKTVGRNSQKR